MDASIQLPRRVDEWRDASAAATLREKAQFCQLVLERIWVDVDTGLVEAVKLRPAFKSIVAQIVHATQMFWPGDPELAACPAADANESPTSRRIVTTWSRCALGTSSLVARRSRTWRMAG